MTAVSKPCMTYTYYCVYSTRLLMMDTCLKHVEFYSKNKFEELVHFVDFIIRIRRLGFPFFFFVFVCLCRRLGALAP